MEIEWEKMIILAVTVVFSVLGAWVAVRVSIAEIKKDKNHIAEKLENEIQSKRDLDDGHKNTIDEVRSDVKGIYRTLTKIQVDIARSNGRDEVLDTVKDTLKALHKNNK